MDSLHPNAEIKDDVLMVEQDHEHRHGASRYHLGEIFITKTVNKIVR